MSDQSPQSLPPRASLDFLRKIAKERLQQLRRADPRAQHATALLAIAREYGFPSWRALKREVERRASGEAAGFFNACAAGDVAAVERMLADAPELARVANAEAPHGGWTGLHSASKGGHHDVVRLLLARGADLHAREAGDNTTPLHWAAAHAHVETVRALLDAGADIHGAGDLHQLAVIGWASYFRAPGDEGAPVDAPRRETIALLEERGARHHIFSAMAVGDLDQIRQVVEGDALALDRRMSPFEQGQTPLHFAITRRRHDMLDLLIELGADLEATNARGQTPLETAMLRGDAPAIERLRAAGAEPPKTAAPSELQNGVAALGDSVAKVVPMLHAPDVAATLAWYASIGFRETARYGDDGEANFGTVALGKAELMLNKYSRTRAGGTSIWLYTDRIDEIYRLLKARQLAAAEATIAGGTSPGGIIFEQDIEDMFYGARQFSIRDPNGYELYFIQGTDS